MSDIKTILNQRGSQYGNFATQATLSQTLYNTIMAHYVQTHPDTRGVPPFIAEALGMICHKLARIGNGNLLYIENWRDISGYATLVADLLLSIEGSTDAVVNYKVSNGTELVDPPQEVQHG